MILESDRKIHNLSDDPDSSSSMPAIEHEPFSKLCKFSRNARQGLEAEEGLHLRRLLPFQSLDWILKACYPRLACHAPFLGPWTINVHPTSDDGGTCTRVGGFARSSADLRCCGLRDGHAAFVAKRAGVLEQVAK